MCIRDSRARCRTVSDFCARRDAPSSRNALTMNQMCGLKALTAKRGHVETTPNTPRLFHSTYLRPHGLAGPQTPSITQHVHVLEPGYWLHLHVPSYRTERPHFAFSSKVTVLGKFPKICSCAIATLSLPLCRYLSPQRGRQWGPGAVASECSV